MCNISEHFTVKEFRCGKEDPCEYCGGELVVSAKLILPLEELRMSVVGGPVIVTSGYRCEKRNQKEGGSSTSFHLKGLAADIVIPKSPGVYYSAEEMFLMVKKIRAFREGGIGLYRDWRDRLHVDIGPERSWFYSKKTNYLSLQEATERGILNL